MKPREYVGINPGGNSNALISVLVPEDFYALRGSDNHPDKIHLIEKSAYDGLVVENEKLLDRAVTAEGLLETAQKNEIYIEGKVKNLEEQMDELRQANAELVAALRKIERLQNPLFAKEVFTMIAEKALEKHGGGK
jgi:hypothetical protein